MMEKAEPVNGLNGDTLSGNDGYKNQTPSADHPAFLRFAAHFISFIFHPLFIPTYVAVYLLYIHPYAYIGLNEKGKLFHFISVFFTTAIMPAFSVFLMKQLGFIKSFFLRTQQDRIIPYIVVMIYYFAVWYLAKIQPENPLIFVAFMLAVFLSSIAAMIANIYFKISMHAIAAGLVFTFFLLIAFNSAVPMGFMLALVTLIAGLVCTARFLVSDHSSFEIYSGLVVGIACQVIAFFFAG